MDSVLIGSKHQEFGSELILQASHSMLKCLKDPEWTERLGLTKDQLEVVRAFYMSAYADIYGSTDIPDQLPPPLPDDY